MLAYFPTPYPDELLFSVVSRLADVMAYPRNNDLSRAVYGQDRPTISVEFPSHLDGLLAVLPPGHRMTADTLISDHTLYPVYQPFLVVESAQALRDKMRGNDGSQVSGYTGLALKAVRPARWLRFCYDCVQADREQYGECYWHRLHQVPGVIVCPIHNAVIQDSQVPAYHRLVKDRYVSAERALTQIEPQSDHLPDPIWQTCCKIADDMAWLLNNHQQQLTPESLQHRFWQILAEKGLASYTGVIRTAIFLNAFVHHYDLELLKRLECPIDYHNTQAWPVQVVTTIGRKHPLQYLLVIHFLGYRVDTFLALPTQATYFGQGPWPCLNPACPDFQQPVIGTCQIDFQGGGTRPRGTFACACGFVYRRVGPDTEATDRFRIGRVMSYGPVWEARFQQLRTNPSLNTEAIARQLQTTPATIVRHAAQFDQPQSTSLLRQESLTSHRERWLAALVKSPEAPLQILREDPDLETTYRWLLTHDRSWYEVHKPSPASKIQARREKSRSPDYYWQNRDIQLAELIRLAALALRQQPGKPMRITLRAICTHLNQASFTSRQQRLPLTSRTIAAVVEPYEAFVIRRLEWVRHQAQASGLRSTKRAWRLAAEVSCFAEPAWTDFADEIWHRVMARKPHEPSLVHDFLPAGQQDWSTLDTSLAAAIQQAAQRLKAQAGYPIWVTVVTLGADIDQLEALVCHLDLLPQTAQTLQAVGEPVEAFVRRVIEWLIQTQAERCRHRAQLIRLSGLKSYMNLPTVAQLIDEAMAQLKTQTQPTSEQRARSVDWLARDDKLAAAVRQAAVMLRMQIDPPQRLSQHAIGHVVETFQLLSVHIWELFVCCLNRLPQTKQALEEVVETHEQFAKRRLEIVADRFRGQSLRPTQTQLLRQAQAEDFAKSPLIRETIETILAAAAAYPSISEVASAKKWMERDDHLHILVETTARFLMDQTGPPVRVSQTAIGKHLGYQFTQGKLKKLPKTTQKLAQALESPEAFAIRQQQPH